MNEFEDYIRYLIVNNENKDNIKTVISKTTKTLDSDDRQKLLDLIISNPELGNINDYLDEFLNTDNSISEINKLVKKMADKKEIEKKLLLKKINVHLKSIIDSFQDFEPYQLVSLLNTISEIEKGLPEEDLESQKIIEQVKCDIEKEVKPLLKKYYCEPDLIDAFRELKIDNSILKDMQDTIIENLGGGSLIRYIQSAKNNEGFDVDWSFEDLAINLFKTGEITMVVDSIEIKMISKIIEELCTNQNIGINDIESAGVGFYSENIKIGKYVLKLGEDRGTETIKNHKRIIKPIVRQQTNLQKKSNIPNLFIEVQNLVDAKWYKDLSEEEVTEELYKIYKELRDDGIVWTDVKPENVGRLLKPNRENLIIDGEEIKSSNYAISSTGKEPVEVLQPGELVVIDTDYLFEDGKPVRVAKVSKYREFEIRYNKEKMDTAKIKKIIENGEYSPLNAESISKYIKNDVISEKRVKNGEGK